MPSKKPRPAPARKPADAKNLRTDWDDVSGWYDQHVGDEGSEFHREIVLPGALRLLEPQPHQSVIDIACGQGVLCRKLHALGVEATGVDASDQLIASARDRSDPAIAYRVADARELSFLPPDRFDAAACLLAIQNIHPIQPVFDGVVRLLKPSGKFIIVMMHPAFRGSKETTWGWDDQNKIQYRRVDRYLTPRKTPIVTHPGKNPHQYTWTFHKPIETYVKSLRKSGLLVDAIEEWPSHKTSTSGPRAAAENLARKEIPLFMALRAIKVERPATFPSPGTQGEASEPGD